MDRIHTGLDVFGCIPFIGDVADGANALLYLAEGDYVNAALSGLSVLPGMDVVTKPAKALIKTGGAAVVVGVGLAKYVDDASGVVLHGHHGFPQAPKSLGPRFRKLGVEPDDSIDYIPDYLHIHKPGSLHTNPNNWNAEWEKWLNENEDKLMGLDKETRVQILWDKLAEMYAEQGIDWSWK